MNTALALCCLGAALACLPGRPGRLRAAVEPPAKPLWRLPKPGRYASFLVPLALAWFVAGPGAAVAAAVATIAGGREWGARRRAAAELAAARHAATALRTIVAELRAGAHPVLAAEAAAETVPELSGELQALAGAAHLDGELRAPALPELARAWTLARRFGLPMADVLDAARRDVESGISFGRRMRARMAGPRASAAVLTGLPAACVLLGEAVGAAPLHVLTATTAGQLLLVAGAFLLWAGTAWSRALTGRVRFR